MVINMYFCTQYYMEDCLTLFLGLVLCDTDWAAPRSPTNIVCKVSWTFAIGRRKPRGTQSLPSIGSRHHPRRIVIGTRLASIFENHSKTNLTINFIACSLHDFSLILHIPNIDINNMSDVI